MAAALTIAVLFALSFGIVRIAAVAMRLTGLSENIARLQCISALTGTGFTTSESEMIVNYPIRRRILVALMIIGSLGLASVAATFIVSFIETEPRPGAIVWQAAMIVIAIGITVVIMSNKTLDRSMCGLIGLILVKTTTLGTRRYQCILQVDDGFCVAEHIYRGADATAVKDLPPSFANLVLLGVHGKSVHRNERISPDARVSPGEVLICYGSDDQHLTFADDLSQVA